MSDKDRVCVVVFHRDKLSLGEANRQRYGLAIYHWAILIRPKDLKRLGSSTVYDSTDGVRVDSHFQDLNPNRDWWFRTRSLLDPLSTGHFLGAVMVGKVPKNLKAEQIQALLEKIPLPVRNQNPEQNCATWIQYAVKALQEAGCAEALSVDTIMREAIRLGDRVLKNGRPKDSRQMFKNLTARPD